jgi:uncharacterized repeat protein (TIGR01451 family)
MHKQHLLKAPLLAALALLLIAPAARAGTASVAPEKVDGNPTCAQLGLTSITKFDPVRSGMQSGVTLEKHHEYYVKWSSTVAVDLVIVKGGSNANVYDYPGDTFGGDWLHAPINPNTGKPYGLSHVDFCTDGKTSPSAHPGIHLDKSVDKNVAYPGETLNYTLKVSNTGDTILNKVELTDELCSSTPQRAGDNAADEVFGPGDVWTYACSYVVPAGSDEVKNVAIACFESTTPATHVSDDERCDTDKVKTPVERIGIEVVKDAVESTAVAGTTVHFRISVTNTGTTTFKTYTFTDENCDEQRTGDNADDEEFNPGDVWTYECAMPTSVGDVSATNTAKAAGSDENCRQAVGQDDATIPLTQPETPGGETPGGETPGGGTPVPSAPAAPAPAVNAPAVTTPASGTLPEAVLSGRARLRGPSGCVDTAFRARVRGRSIASVRFYVDGRLVKRFSGRRASYTIKVKPRGLGFGRHRVVARVTFTRASGTAPRTLRLTFRRCSQGAIAPRFTG